MNKFFKIIKWPVLILVLAFLYVRYSDTRNSSHEHENDYDHEHEQVGQDQSGSKAAKQKKTAAKDSQVKSNSVTQKEIIKKIRSFSYEEETKRINKMTSQYPETRQQIIDLVSKSDPYKDAKIEIEPHTVDSIKQNQIGALKVLALKSIETKEKDISKRVKFYQDLLAQAKDPTIIKIARAGLESAKQGRPFLKDFIDGINNGPAKKEN